MPAQSAAAILLSGFFPPFSSLHFFFPVLLFFFFQRAIELFSLPLPSAVSNHPSPIRHTHQGSQNPAATAAHVWPPSWTTSSSGPASSRPTAATSPALPMTVPSRPTSRSRAPSSPPRAHPRPRPSLRSPTVPLHRPPRPPAALPHSAPLPPRQQGVQSPPQAPRARPTRIARPCA